MTPRYLDARDMSERIMLGCSLVLDEPAHLGGADPDATSERPLVRNADGQVYLAGAALKGVLRGGRDHRELFGDATLQARLIVDDAPLAAHVATQLRDGVAIDEKLGIAAHRRKYDLEVLPIGTRFEARFEATVPTDGAAFLGELCGVLEQLSEGLAVGARTRRGLGRIRRDGPWAVRRYAGPSGLRAWLADGFHVDPAEWRGAATEHDDLAAALGVSPAIVHAHDEVVIHLELKIVGSLLIRSTPAGGSPAEQAQLHTVFADGARQPALSGTALAGVLRARCRRIVRTLSAAHRGDDLVEGLFGPGETDPKHARASRLRVGEARIEGAHTLRHTRVQIDPWTGGAAASQLFTSEPTYGGTASPVLRWRRPSDTRQERAERALLLLALRDLVLGDLPLGGESAAGRGRLAPSHEDGRFGRFGDLELRLTTARGLEGDFSEDLEALREWCHG